MTTYRVMQVDVFTRQRFRGNPAGVVPDAAGLTDVQMQDIARELHCSETAFILPPDGDDHDIRIRFFTPTTEVPSCGHATIAAHFVRALELKLPPTTVRHKIGIGVLPADVVQEAGQYRIVVTQGKVSLTPPLGAVEREMVLAALGVSGDEAEERCPVQVVDTGHSKLIVAVNSRETLDALDPDRHALIEVAHRLGNRGYFVFAFAGRDEPVLTHARMFAPQIGIDEDPVTGNGNGPLGAYLVANELVAVDGPVFRFDGEQGSRMGRSGIATVWVDVAGGQPARVRVGGDAVIAFETTIAL